MEKELYECSECFDKVPVMELRYVEEKELPVCVGCFETISIENSNTNN